MSSLSVFRHARLEIGIAQARFRAPFTAAGQPRRCRPPHAGETTGPATVCSARPDLGAERIAHGVQAIISALPETP